MRRVEYFTKGYEIQDLIGGGRLGDLNYVTGPVEFVVAAKDAPKARELRAHLKDAVPDEPHVGLFGTSRHSQDQVFATLRDQVTDIIIRTSMCSSGSPPAAQRRWIAPGCH
jgi:hypothetical protein